MELKLLHYKNSSINYYRFGNGHKKVVCFHGYGEDALSFEFLNDHTNDQFTFYAVDLPFHGETQWNEGLDFTTKDLQNITNAILSDRNDIVQSIDFSIIGFSLGGRVALSLLQSQPQNIHKLILLAPDGLKINSWYWLATQTWIGNQLFSLTMKHPAWFLALLKLLNKLKLVNTSILKFVNTYIGDERVRLLLYQRWTTLRKLKPKIEKIKILIKGNNIPVRLIYGKHDRIILSSVGEKFIKGIQEQSTLTILNGGHQVLQKKYMAEILAALLS